MWDPVLQFGFYILYFGGCTVHVEGVGVMRHTGNSEAEQFVQGASEGRSKLASACMHLDQEVISA